MNNASPGCSRPVVSDQAGIHPRLQGVVERHRLKPFRRPAACVAAPELAAVAAVVEVHRGPVLLDNGCGTGESTVALAHRQPAALVIGIDKSAARLERARRHVVPNNATFVRANLVDVWRAARYRNWAVDTCYLLYPNPWPKQSQLMRRWHAHPAFADLLALGARLELRSNWALYVAEFGRALEQWGGYTVTSGSWQPDNPVSAFERKYLASGHALFRLVAEPVLSRQNRRGRGQSGSVRFPSD